ncbi:YqiA/YcfP family alpha/beta fold hydrolase [Psychrobacter sp. LV10R520-6]|uniref:YqiA/YcfP family alpha/beta fold hydrolase n=1 Tax=Psychrobacter sp. LV10R520-6 TaxID=1415574 RepID=UPI002AA0E506|nr:YqiA/YcfP family alpha/beta fold hydrolase [Psychrobacter sp. LV10R520-6]
MITNLGDISKTVSVGSSLGGYFSALVSNHTGCPVLLLNPSTQPHITLQRFSEQPILDDIAENKRLSSQVMHMTAGGWAITGADLQWFADHPLLSVNYPQKTAVWIKKGDELLNPQVSAEFYQQQGAAVTLQTGGDHRFSNFARRLPVVIRTLQQLK